MSLENVKLELAEKRLKNAKVAATGQDVTIGHLVRHLLAKEIDRRVNPKAPNLADGGLVAALQTLLAGDIAKARGWGDLATRLGRHGYELRASGGGLTLYKSSCGTRLCKGSELGLNYPSLVERFQTGMPGYPQETLQLDHPEQPKAPPRSSKLR